MLKTEQDAYGQMMLDYLRDGSGYEIVEHEDGHFGIGAGPRLYFSDFDEWRQAERDAITYASGRILDVGCGAGRFMLWLQEGGYEVVGIDVSPGAVAVCKQRGLSDVHPLAVSQVSRRLGLFDTFLLLGGNMALLGPRDRARHNLARLHRVARPGARLLGANRDWSKSTDPETLAKAERNMAAGQFSGEHRSRIRYQRFVTPFFTSSRMSPEELQELIVGTGWFLSEVIDRGEGIYIAVLGAVHDP